MLGLVGDPPRAKMAKEVTSPSGFQALNSIFGPVLRLSFKFQVSSLLSLPKELVTINTACKSRANLGRRLLKTHKHELLVEGVKKVKFEYINYLSREGKKKSDEKWRKTSA